MAGSGAGVATVRPRKHAGLVAGALSQALAPVAEPPAAVTVTRQQLVTSQTAGDVLQVAGDVAALLWAGETTSLEQQERNIIRLN